jgi:hypothetical protein
MGGAARRLDDASKTQSVVHLDYGIRVERFEPVVEIEVLDRLGDDEVQLATGVWYPMESRT